MGRYILEDVAAEDVVAEDVVSGEVATEIVVSDEVDVTGASVRVTDTDVGGSIGNVVEKETAGAASIAMTRMIHSIPTAARFRWSWVLKSALRMIETTFGRRLRTSALRLPPNICFSQILQSPYSSRSSQAQ
jgi:hypothetical protein